MYTTLFLFSKKEIMGHEQFDINTSIINSYLAKVQKLDNTSESGIIKYLRDTVKTVFTLLKKERFENHEVGKIFTQLTIGQLLLGGKTFYMNSCIDYSMVTIECLKRAGIETTLVVDEIKSKERYKVHFGVEIHVDGETYYIDFRERNEVFIGKGNFESKYEKGSKHETKGSETTHNTIKIDAKGINMNDNIHTLKERHFGTPKFFNEKELTAGVQQIQKDNTPELWKTLNKPEFHKPIISVEDDQERTKTFLSPQWNKEAFNNAPGILHDVFEIQDDGSFLVKDVEESKVLQGHLKKELPIVPGVVLKKLFMDITGYEGSNTKTEFLDPVFPGQTIRISPYGILNNENKELVSIQAFTGEVQEPKNDARNFTPADENKDSYLLQNGHFRFGDVAFKELPVQDGSQFTGNFKIPETFIRTEKGKVPNIIMGEFAAQTGSFITSTILNTAPLRETEKGIAKGGIIFTFKSETLKSYNKEILPGEEITVKGEIIELNVKKRKAHFCYTIYNTKGEKLFTGEIEGNVVPIKAVGMAYKSHESKLMKQLIKEIGEDERGICSTIVFNHLNGKTVPDNGVFKAEDIRSAEEMEEIAQEIATHLKNIQKPIIQKKTAKVVSLHYGKKLGEQVIQHIAA